MLLTLSKTAYTKEFTTDYIAVQSIQKMAELENPVLPLLFFHYTHNTSDTKCVGGGFHHQAILSATS